MAIGNAVVTFPTLAKTTHATTNQKEITMNMTYTELQVLKKALGRITENNLQYWVDDDGNPITDEWLEALYEKIEKLEN